MKTINIKPADRVGNIQEYYFSKKLKEVAKLNSEGYDVISLGIGGPDKAPADCVIDELCENSRKQDAHSYQPFTGLPQLRKAYSKFYKEHYDVELDYDSEIQPLIGSKEAILHLSLTFLNPGDGVLVPDPGYITYSSASKLAQAQIFKYDLTEDNNWWPDFEAIERLPLGKIKLMWVNYPHMPTGAPASMELFEKIVEFGRRHNIVIVNDNPYSFILNENPISILQVAGAKEIALEMNSLSKSHNMAGWRMGMVASNKDFIDWFIRVKSNVDSGQFKPMMLAAVKALELPEEWYAKINATYSERRIIAEKIMNQLGCTFDKSQRGLFLWGRVPESVEDVESFTDRILYDAHVFITPGFIFGENGKRYIRISLCATPEKLSEALDRISKII